MSVATTTIMFAGVAWSVLTAPPVDPSFHCLPPKLRDSLISVQTPGSTPYLCRKDEPVTGVATPPVVTTAKPANITPKAAVVVKKPVKTIVQKKTSKLKKK